MLYDNLDILPLKTYMRILNTGKLELLTDEHDNYKYELLKKTWLELQKEYNKLGISEGTKKIIDVSYRIEALKTKYDFISASAGALSFERDGELENWLREFGYQLRVDSTEHYQEDLNRISREASDILVKAKRLSTDLERKRSAQNGKGNHTIDTIIMGYMSATGITYDTNKITVMQFDALKNTFEQKLKSIEANTPKASKAQQLKNKRA